MKTTVYINSFRVAASKAGEEESDLIPPPDGVQIGDEVVVYVQHEGKVFKAVGKLEDSGFENQPEV